MPFYEYECSACKFYVEALQKVSDEPLRQCPSCKKPALKRLISAPVFRLKGGGWYETDFKSDGEQKRNIHGREEAEAKAEPARETKEAQPTAAESKPAESKTAESKTAGGEARTKAAAPVAKAARAKAGPKRSHAKSKATKSSARSKAGRRR